MKYASVCSGIEAATVAWHPLGWEPVFFAEIEKFPRKVLAHRYPDVLNIGDMTKINGTEWRGKIDLLVGGTPCQDFSVAGKRAGFEGARGGLTYEYVRLLREARPEWFLWENVPGVLQGKMQDGFIHFLRSIAELGYHLEWRTLDAQYVRVDGFPRGVPQRRRRVFVVGHLGGCGGQPILFEPQSLCGDSAPRRKAREETSGVACEGIDHELARTQYGHVAGTLTARHNSSPCADRGQNVIAIAGITRGFSPTLTCTHDGSPIVCHGTQDPCTSKDVAFALGRNNGQENVVAFSCKDSWQDSSCVSPTLRAMNGKRLCGGGQVAIAIAGNIIGRQPENGSNGIGYDDTGSAYTLTAADRHGVCYPIDTRNALRDPDKKDEMNRQGCGVGDDGDPSPTLTRMFTPAVSTGSIVRRLTPRECERLQGFPDDYTLVPGASDSTRYKALGNSMAVNVMRWIGRRISNHPANWLS